jgi:hypothetical protein
MLAGWITGHLGANATGVAILVLNVTHKPHLDAGRGVIKRRLFFVP